MRILNAGVSSPLPACGERSTRIARCAAGEGDYPRVRARGESPSPQPSPRKRGEGAHRALGAAGARDAGTRMTYPGEKFYPPGVRWDDSIARGTLPELMATAAMEYGARTAIEFRDRPISYAQLEERVEIAASALL